MSKQEDCKILCMVGEGQRTKLVPTIECYLLTGLLDSRMIELIPENGLGS